MVAVIGCDWDGVGQSLSTSMPSDGSVAAAAGVLSCSGWYLV